MTEIGCFCAIPANTSSGISSVESSIITQLSDIKNKLDSLEERVAVYKTALLKGQKQLSDAVTQSCSHNSISGYMKGYFPNT